jgi:hypothetical protein
MALTSLFGDTCVDASFDDGFLAAELAAVRRCPARPEYIELRFITPEGAWNWCFPRPARQRKQAAAGPIALTLGPYGVLARLVGGGGFGRGDSGGPGGGFGPALDAGAALPMILAGADVVVARRLVAAGR